VLHCGSTDNTEIVMMMYLLAVACREWSVEAAIHFWSTQDQPTQPVTVVVGLESHYSPCLQLIVISLCEGVLFAGLTEG